METDKLLNLENKSDDRPEQHVTRSFASKPGVLVFAAITAILFSISQITDSALGFVSLESKSKDEPETRGAPNIVLVTFDDMGWNDIGYHSTDLPKATPFLNSLASKGLKLNNYHTQPSCTPSRVTLMTGKYAYKNGFQNTEIQPVYAIGVPLSNKLMPARLRELGYRTVGYGKWNIGHCNEKYMPHMRGFHEFIGYFCPGHGYNSDHRCSRYEELKDMYYGYNNNHDSKMAGDDAADVDAQEGQVGFETGKMFEDIYDTLLYTDKAVSYIYEHARKDSDKPLFMWLAHHGMHGEEDSEPEPPSSLLTDANHEYLKVLKKREDEAKGDDKKFYKKRYVTATVLMSLDNSIHSVVDALEGSGMMDNTIMFFNSDNGGMAAYSDGVQGNNWPLRSQKFDYFEGGVHVPAFVYAPTLLPASRQGATFGGLMHHVDLLTTFVVLAGGEDPTLKEHDLDGHDFWPALSTPSVEPPRDEIIFNLPRNSDWRWGTNETLQGIALISGRYKLMVNQADAGWYEPKPEAANESVVECVFEWYTGTHNCHNVMLFDLENDPSEKHNLANSTAHLAVKEMMIERAVELTRSQGNYGRILHEFYGNNSLSTAELINSTEFADHYLTSWGCSTIP